MNSTRRLILTVTGLMILLAACAAPGGDSPPPTTDESAGPTPTRPMASSRPLHTVPPASGGGITGEVPQELLGRILADAAERSGVSEDDMEVIRAEFVTWNDGSLGCPEPGQVYTQALIDGFHIILDAGGEELDYRADAGGGFRLCGSGGRPSG